MPDWARGRMNATIIMISQAATALGSLVWGTAAATAGVVATFLAMAALAIVAMIIARLAFRLSIDFTTDLNIEPAPATMFSNTPSRLPDPQEGPLSITTEFQVDTDRRQDFFDLAGKARLIYLRNGAHGWHLKEDLARPNSFQIEVIVPSWTHNLRKRERITKDETEIIDQLHSLHLGPNPPDEWTSLYLDKEVLSKNSLLGPAPEMNGPRI
jgi:hypothetical protein